MCQKFSVKVWIAVSNDQKLIIEMEISANQIRP